MSFPEGLFAPAARVNAEGSAIGPAPAWPAATPLTAILDRHAGPAGPAGRALAVEVETGLLVCGACGRWFPIADWLPELLPDHLRDWTRDRERLETAAAAVPQDLLDALRRYVPVAAAGDAGAHYKTAEISIRDKVDDPGFFGPGYSSPFNPWNPDFTTYLIKLFANVVPLLDLKRGGIVLDSGSGYSWTTEWLFRSGYDAIGLDISRTYLDIGVQRMGALRPHLVVADVEHLPLKAESVDAVLAYESFHHVPDRPKAMAGYARVLRPGRPIVLAEPGGEHEHAEVAMDAMRKYGILEKGLELHDLQEYIDGTAFAPPEQHFVVRSTAGAFGGRYDRAFARAHAVIENNVFRTWKTGLTDRARTVHPGRTRWPGIRRRVNSALRRLGLD